uniref:Uncharacterized protein n=1 Tax=Rhizophora mucronata TaxID=61149 RepID=A0A2P2JVF3_RHIMU
MPHKADLCYFLLVLQKQFKQQNIHRAPHKIEDSSPQEAEAACVSTDGNSANVLDGSQPVVQNQPVQSSPKGERKSIHDRMRVPVSYDDLLIDNAKDHSTKFQET